MYNKGYLTEKILGKLLIKNIDGDIYPQFPMRGRDNTLASKYGVLNFKKKFDYAFEYNNQLYLVEFDGIQHFNNPLNIMNDYHHRHRFNNDSINIIEIPYFIQLNKNTTKYFFNWIQNFDFIVDGCDYSLFPSGFWSDKALIHQTPAFFCALGHDKYLGLLRHYKSCKKEIQESIQRGHDLGLSKKVLYFEQ